MWTYLKKNHHKISDDDLRREVTKLVDDEEVWKKRRDRMVAKVGEAMAKGALFTEGEDVDDTDLV